MFSWKKLQTADRHRQRLAGEHSTKPLAAKRPNITSAVGKDRNRVRERLNIGFTFIRWAETRLQINYNVC